MLCCSHCARLCTQNVFSTEPANDSENISSSFAFLAQSPPPIESPEAEQSPFRFLSGQQEMEQEVEQEVKPPGFSFMQESHDNEPQSTTPIDIISEPQSPLIKSQDKDTKSHDAKQSPVTKASRQLAPIKKKKKKTAKRPGQMVKEEPQENDTTSLSSHASSLDSARLDDTLLSPDRVVVSTDHGVAQLVNIDYKDDQVTAEDTRILEAPKEVIEVPSVATELNKVSTGSEEVDAANGDTKSKKSCSKLTKQDEPVSLSHATPLDDNATPPGDQATPHDDQATPPEEGLDGRELAEVFTQRPNYSLELSTGDKLTVLLEGFESGLDGIRYG